jgi:hypothetical protein
MKKLIYIDNDNERRAKEDVDYVKNNLEYVGGLPAEQVEQMEIVSDFGHIGKEKVYELLFSKNNCICSWSMYTANHYGSLYQLISLLKAAGRNRIKDIVYVDGSGMLQKALERELPNIKEPYDLLNAIETNHIISFDLEADLCFRLRLEFKGVDESPFKRDRVSLLELLK